MSHDNSYRLRSVIACGLLSTGLLAGAGSAQAYNSFSKDFSDLYPDSTTDKAGCATCHGSNSSTLNAYGKDLCLALDGIVPKDSKPYLEAIKMINSDKDPTGSDNETEINANAQPGWTTGAENKLYSTSNCVATGASVAPPKGVPLPYDPPAEGYPVAVPGGPYSGLVGIPIVFDGTGSYDTDDGEIVDYSWDFGDGSAGTYTVTLSVTDDDGNISSNETIATVSAESALDLDIAALSISKTARVGKPISIKLSVLNNGSVTGQAFATIVGVMNGSEIYRWRQNVFDDLSKGSTTFTFPSYTPKAAGTIEWTADIADGDPDEDIAEATTLVK